MIRRYTPWILLAALLLLVYLTQSILFPFVVGLAIAYLLDPAADMLVEWNLPRSLAAGLIIAAFFVIGAGAVLALMPLIQSQIAGLVGALPDALAALRPVVDSALSVLTEELGVEIERDAQSLLSAAARQGLSQAGQVISGALAQGAALFNLFMLLLISPVVAFYLLRDYDRLVDQVDQLLPAEYKSVIKEQFHEIDRVLSGFVRGQLLVSLAMAALYAIGWSAIGLRFGLILGLVAGVMAIVPFVGTLLTAMVAVLIAFGQFGPDILQIGLVFGVFLIVQVIESSFLTPKLIGSRVGLHPVWVLFAVFAGGELAGFVGVLIAVPAAAVIAVLVRFGVKNYIPGKPLATAIQGQDDPDGPERPGALP